MSPIRTLISNGLQRPITRPPHCLEVGRRWISVKGLDEALGNRERILILGSGWSGYGLARLINQKHFQPVIITPRTYFVFTPLLASTAVGTLEFRTAMEPSRGLKGVSVIRGWADALDVSAKTLTIEGVTDAHHKSSKFALPYTKLAISVGAYAQTFNTPGVTEHAFFLKDVSDARRIRRRILARFEEAALPTTSLDRARDLLHFCIVGGGPTGIEFAAELHDLVAEDLGRVYPHLAEVVRITVFDVAPSILGMFDAKLQAYARETFKRQGIELRTLHHVEAIEEDAIVTKEEGRIPAGAVVWSTGLAPNPFVAKALGADGVGARTVKKTGHVVTDEYLRVLDSTGAPIDDVFALGDCAQIENKPLPATAQVADQQAKWLARTLNSAARSGAKNGGTIDVTAGGKEFRFRSLGIMAYLGGWRAITQSDTTGDLKGRLSWVLWRTAYLSKSVSWRNRLLIPVYWVVNWVLGRDINRF